MKETITLYNHFHNGDVFFSRVMINILSKKYNIRYYHNQRMPLLNDIENLEEISGIPNSYYPANETFISQNIINTWIGQNNMMYLNSVNVNSGCTFENYFTLCKMISDSYNIELSDVEEYLPQVDYDKLPNITNVVDTIKELKLLYNKIVLISNGNVKSNQSENFDFTPIINQLSNDYSDILFLTTQSIGAANKNVLSIDTITKIVPDLLLISYISTECDIIVGRASGPFCFSQTKENLLNPNKTFISFNHRYSEGKYYQNQKSKFVWSNDYSYDNVLEIIKLNL